MPPKKKKGRPPAQAPSTASVAARCQHYRIIAEPTKVPDQVAFRCLECDATLPHDFASPAH
jgi:hypothetical protein